MDLLKSYKLNFGAEPTLIWGKKGKRGLRGEREREYPSWRVKKIIYANLFVFGGEKNRISNGRPRNVPKNHVACLHFARILQSYLDRPLRARVQEYPAHEQNISVKNYGGQCFAQRPLWGKGGGQKG